MVAANETTLTELLGGPIQYLVPLYQRPYQWGKKELRTLWRDLVELVEDRNAGEQSSHFVGSVVLSPNPASVAGGISKFLVVDGQQRLTTLTLLLAAIRDHLDKRDPEGLAGEEIQETYLINKFKKDPEHLKLVPTQKDRASYSAIIKRSMNRGGDDNVGFAYRFFLAQLESLEGGENDVGIREVQDAVLTGLAIVSISTHPDDNVHRIFQSLNNTGMKLTQGDLIRNYIFMRLPSSGDTVYEQYWKPMQEQLENEQIEHLFWIDLASEHPTAKLDDTFNLQQRRLDAMSSEFEVEKDVKRLSSLGSLYKLILEPGEETNPEVRHRLQRIGEWGSNTPHPLMLKFLEMREHGSVDSHQLAEALHIIEAYLIRRFLIGKATQGLNRIFRAAVSAVGATQPIDEWISDYLSSGRRHYVGDKELRDAIARTPYFLTGNRKHRKTLLTWLEREFESQEPVDTTRLSIEHVMPQTLTPAWQDYLAENSDQEDMREAYDASVHTLGNLTLTGYNSQMSNRSFVEKKKELIRSGVRLSQSITVQDKWGPEEITRRGDALADLIIDRWPGPVESTIDSDENPIWIKLRQILAALPAGKWTTYGDLAAAIGSAAQPVGNFLATRIVPNAHRVLRSGGVVSESFEWIDEKETRQPVEILTEEGVEFTKRGRAIERQRLKPGNLLDLIAEELEDESA